MVLATFGTADDAALLTAYLDHYLARPDLDYDQGVAPPRDQAVKGTGWISSAL